jgi:hypothetical protein
MCASAQRAVNIQINSKNHEQRARLSFAAQNDEPPEPERATEKRASTNQSQSTAGATTGLRKARERTEVRKKLWIGGRLINVMNVTLLTDLTKASLRGP